MRHRHEFREGGARETGAGSGGEALPHTLEHLRIRTEAALARKDGELRGLRAEIACLQIIKQRFESVVDNVPCMLFACGSDGAVTYMNGSFTRFTGCPPEDALGDGWQRFAHPDDIGAVREALVTAIRTGVSLGVSMRMRLPEGGFLKFHASGTAVRDSNGGFLEWYGMLVPESGPRSFDTHGPDTGPDTGPAAFS